MLCLKNFYFYLGFIPWVSVCRSIRPFFSFNISMFYLLISDRLMFDLKKGENRIYFTSTSLRLDVTIKAPLLFLTVFQIRVYVTSGLMD